MAHVPSHHDHKLGEWIGIRAEVDHVVTFNRSCPVADRDLCQMPCAKTEGCEHTENKYQTVKFA
jgi:iron(III) transport system ATP-binding protein